MYDHFEFFENMQRNLETEKANAQRVIAYHWRKKLVRMKKKKRAAQKKNHILENKANLARRETKVG